MAISYIGSATGTTSATIPTTAAGDVVIAFAFRSGSTTAPTLPSGWTTLGNAGANTCSYRVGYFVATGTSTSSGTWTNATQVTFHVYRGLSTSSPAATPVATAGSSTTVSYPALTLARTDGSSWVACFGGHRSTNTTLETAPTGTTNRSNVVGTAEVAGADTNGGVTSWSVQSVSVGGTSSGWYGVSVELKAAPPTGTGGSFDFNQTTGTPVGDIDARWQGIGTSTLQCTAAGRLGVVSGSEWNTYHALLVSGQGTTQKAQLDVCGQNYSFVTLQQTPGTTGSGYYLCINGSGVAELKRAGTWVASGSTTFSPTTSSPVTLRLEVTSGVVTAYVNNTLQFTYTDTSPITGGYPGIMLGGGGPSQTDMLADNFSDLTIGSGGSTKYIAASSTDVLTLTVVVARTRPVVASSSDVVTNTAAVRRSRSVAATTADTLSMSATNKRTRSTSASSTDTVTMSSAVNRGRGIAASTTDTVGMTSAVARARRASVAGSDTLSMSGTTKRQRGVQASTTDTVNVLAAVARARKAAATSTDVLTITAAARRAVRVAAASIDSIAMAVNVTVVRPGGSVKYISAASIDTITLAAAIKRTRAVLAASTDGVNVSTAVKRTRKAAASSSDMVNANAAVKRSRGVTASSTDALNVASAVKRTRSTSASSTDTLTFATINTKRLRGIVAAAVDGVDFEVAVQRLRGIAASMSDTLQINVTVQVQRDDKGLITATFKWTEWVMTNGVLREVERSATTQFDSHVEATQMIDSHVFATVVVESLDMES